MTEELGTYDRRLEDLKTCGQTTEDLKTQDLRTGKSVATSVRIPLKSPMSYVFPSYVASKSTP